MYLRSDLLAQQLQGEINQGLFEAPQVSPTLKAALTVSQTTINPLSEIYTMIYLFNFQSGYITGDFTAEITCFFFENGLVVVKMKCTSVRKKEYRADVRRGCWM